MNFIKYHWFGLLTGLIIFCFLGLFILVLLSPRQDASSRGFIPCTEAMADRMLACEKNKVRCMLGAIIKNSWCDAKVVGTGLKSWVRGRQAYPWSNYIFIPDTAPDADFDQDARYEYLQHNPDPRQEMLKLQQLNKELENEQHQQLDPGQSPQ